MGVWGAKPLENDAAQDFVSRLESSSRRKTILEKSLQSGADGETEEEEGFIAVAAANLVAYAIDGQVGDGIPEGLGAWLLSQDAEQRRAWVKMAVKALESVDAASELRSLWEEAGELPKWRAEISALSGRLRRKPISPKKDASKRKPSNQGRVFSAGAVFRLALPNGEYAWGRMYEPEHFGIYNLFSKDATPSPIGMREFFGFFRLYRTEYRRDGIAQVGEDPFADGEQNWQPMFTFEFPNFVLRRIMGDDCEDRMASTDEVAGLSPDRIRSLESLVETLATRHSPEAAQTLFPKLPGEDGRNIPQPWAEWPRIRARLVAAHGEDFEDILFRKRWGYGKPARPVS